MKLFLDTNILIDVVANRKPWVDEALVLFELAKQQQFSLVVADFSFINLAYITRKLFSQEELYALFCDFCRYVEIVEVGGEVIEKSFQNQWKDMEDCIQLFMIHSTLRRSSIVFLMTSSSSPLTLAPAA